MVALWRALEAGDVLAADRIHGLLAALIWMQTSLDAFITIEKHLLVKQGVLPSAVLRGPVGYWLDAETAAEAERLAARLAHIVSLTPEFARDVPIIGLDADAASALP